MLISASLLKYAYISAASSEIVNVNGVSWSLLTMFVGIIIGVLFFWALTSAHGGLIVLNKLLWARFNRYPEWDEFM